jgi:hypothetical protein
MAWNFEKIQGNPFFFVFPGGKKKIMMKKKGAIRAREVILSITFLPGKRAVRIVPHRHP